MFLVNRRLGLVSAAPSRSPLLEWFTLPGRPFSRSYGANLPSSLTGVLSSTSVYSTSPPVSVCGTVTPQLARGFSRRSGLNPYGLALRPRLTLPSQRDDPADLPARPAYRVGGCRHPLVCAPGPWLPKARALFSRSYEGILPSSFNIVLSSALVYSTCPPVSVSGTVHM